MRTLLVTGGAGFIGSNFIRYMLQKHDDLRIINIDKLGYGSNLMNLDDVKDNPQYTFLKGDVCNFDTIKDIVSRSDAIVNFAAESHVDRSISNPTMFVDNNIFSVKSILEALRKTNKRIRFVHISTDEVYGDITNGSFTEEDRLRPSSPYSASKAAGDMLVLGYARTYNLDVSITRCTNNYGPYQFPEKLIPKTIIRATMGMSIPIYGTGKNTRDWLYVIDHCEAIERVLEQGENMEIYNISAREEKTNIEVVKAILKIMGKNDDLIEFVEDRPGHDIRYSIDSTKIREQLGWKPRYNFKEGIEETVKWYLNNKEWWERLIDDNVLSKMPWKLRW